MADFAGRFYGAEVRLQARHRTRARAGRDDARDRGRPGDKVW